MRILIAEDEAIIAHDITDIVEQFGHTVVGVVDTVEGVLETVATVRPDIVLLDIRLHGNGDGISAGQVLWGTFQVPVVYLTALADDDTLRRASATAPFGYLCKPFSEQALQRTLEAAYATYLTWRATPLSVVPLLPPESLLTLLDTLFANTLVGLAFIDRDLRFVRINDALAAMNGQPASSHIGQQVREVLPHLADRLEPLYRAVFTSLQPILNLELRGETRTAPGDARHWLMSCYPVAAPAAPPIGLGVIVVEISAVRYADQALRTYADQMRALSLRLVNAQETERRALAHELHDEIGQLLTGLNMVLEAGTQETADQIRARLRTAQQTVTALTGQVRQLSLDLLPPMLDDLGLLPTLHWYIRRYHEQTHIAVDFKYGKLPTPLLPQLVIVAYRIVQEGLTNVARYAQVDHAAVQIWLHQGQLAITIEDEGCGFDVAAALHAHHSVGLAGMHERVLLLGGQLRIDSAPGEGTRLSALLPLTPEATAEEGR